MPRSDRYEQRTREATDLLEHVQNRRTDDPTEEDRSESYSIKPQKTYTWKQENIRTGKLPSKPEKPKAKAKEPEPKPLTTPDLLYIITWKEFLELVSQDAPGGFKELL